MSLDKIKAMKETADRMKEMEKEVLDECKKDRKQLRWDALQQIFAYFDELADSVGEDVKIYFKEFTDDSLLGCCDSWVSLNLNRKYYIQHAYNGCREKRSEEPIKWFIQGNHGTRVDEIEYRFFDYIDASVTLEEACPNGTWQRGYLKLIENWDVYKPGIEKEVMKHFEQKMESIRKNTESNLTAYEKAANFTV